MLSEQSEKKTRLCKSKLSLQTVVDSCTEESMKIQSGKRKHEVERFTDKTVVNCCLTPLDLAHRSSLNLVTSFIFSACTLVQCTPCSHLERKKHSLERLSTNHFRNRENPYTPTVRIFSDNSLRSLCLSWVRTDLLIGPPFHPNTALKTTLNTFLN